MVLKVRIHTSFLIPSPSKYGAFNRWDALKVLALFLMIIDHVGVFYFPENDYFRALGRGAAPIFLFLVGFAPSNRVSVALILTAIAVAAANVAVGGDIMPLNILFTIILYRLWLRYVHPKDKDEPVQRWKFWPMVLRRPLEWVIIITFFFLPTSLVIEGGGFMMLFALAGYVFRYEAVYGKRCGLGILLFAMVLQGFFQGWAQHFTLLPAALMVATMGSVAYLLYWGTRNPRAETGIPHSFNWLSRYTLFLYGAHVIALHLLTGKPF